MRHTVLSLMVAFLAAIACFVLLPVGLVLLKPAAHRTRARALIFWLDYDLGPNLICPSCYFAAGQRH
jgi:hypothetical protein